MPIFWCLINLLPVGLPRTPHPHPGSHSSSVSGPSSVKGVLALAKLGFHQDLILSGWWFQPLWKILLSWDYCSQYIYIYIHTYVKTSYIPNKFRRPILKLILGRIEMTYDSFCQHLSFCQDRVKLNWPEWDDTIFTAWWLHSCGARYVNDVSMPKLQTSQWPPLRHGNYGWRIKNGRIAQKSCSFQTSGSFYLSDKFLEAPSSHIDNMPCVLGANFPQRGRSMALKSRGLLGTAHLVCNFFASRFARFFKTILQVFPIPKTRKAGQRWPYMSCASWRTIRTSNQDACKIQIQLESARHFEYFWVMLIRCHPISDSLCVPCVSSSPRCRCGSGASQWTCHGVHAWPGFLSPRFWQIPECLAKKLEMPKWIRKSGTHAKLCTTWQKIQNIEKMKHCRLFHIFHIYI